FLIVITTNEIIMCDLAHMGSDLWDRIVVDEGHHFENIDRKLMQEIRRYKVNGRMISTGTSFQICSSCDQFELYALMNSILPDLFSDLESFQEWFVICLSAFDILVIVLQVRKSTSIIYALHTILKPFLLGRIKADV
ncbi:SNF2 family N-terminal domain-containing protein, partial [Flagelloscypha sp. PMI_526]